MQLSHPIVHGKPELGLAEPTEGAKRVQKIDSYFNAEVDDIYKNQYLSPRPQVTTLQIPVQGVGEWCHPQYTPEINDSVFRTLIKGDEFVMAGVPFLTPKDGSASYWYVEVGPAGQQDCLSLGKIG